MSKIEITTDGKLIHCGEIVGMIRWKKPFCESDVAGEYFGDIDVAEEYFADGDVECACHEMAAEIASLK